jgi:HEAT repeat protein
MIRHRSPSMLSTLLLALTLAPVAAAREPASKTSLLGELGAPAAERLLASDAAPERLRALARLSALGTPRAIELLTRALDPGGAARGAEEHLAAVRALAPHAKHGMAQAALVRALSSPPVEADAGPLSDWVQSAAALALARSGDPGALAALGRALKKPGHAAELARDALIDNPPRELAPLLQAPGAPTKELCETLGALGDQRAEGFLRDTVRRGSPEARGAAALALAKLGSTEVIELSRHWLSSERQPALVAAGARILTERAMPGATEALARLVEVDGTRQLALKLFLRAGGRVAAPPSLSLETVSPPSFELLEAFALGGAWAASRLEQALAAPDSAGLAIYALSRAPGRAAQQRLERALSEPRLRSFAVRALGLRQQRFAEESRALTDMLPQLARSRVDAERAAAIAVTCGSSSEALATALASTDPAVVRAAARLAFAGKPAELAVRRLLRERGASLRAQLGIGLADERAAALAPTAFLLELTHEAGPASWLAAAALAARKDAELLPLIRELLASGDPWLRAHALLGLGRASDPDVLGLIENAYRFEPDASVRHAAVVALSQRAEPVRRRALRLAAELDGSAPVREAARLALSGQVLGMSGAGPEAVWVEIAKNRGVAPGELPAATLRVGAGLALPVVADADGVAVVAGVDPARVELRLALLEERVNGDGARP